MEREKSSKRRKEMDRLGSLPDNLIHHILSFMDMDCAVQTCILSKRWVNQWMHIYFVNFSSKSISRLNTRALISNVLNKLKATKLSGLQFYYDGEYSIEKFLLLYKVVDFAVSLNVEKVDLFLTGNWLSLLLPSSFFKCQYLKVLRIQGFCDFEFPETLEWASLETLSLSNLTLSNNKDFSSFDIFSKCPNLQNLSLLDVGTEILECHQTFIISAPRLVFLTIKNLNIWFLDSSSKLVINAPRLKWFYFQGFEPLLMSVVIINSPLLHKVDFGIRSSNTDADDLIDTMRQFGNARSLTVSKRVIEVLSKHSGLLSKRPSPFVKLESFSVKLEDRNDFITISLPLMNFFLGSSPSSAGLKLQMDFPKGNDNDIFKHSS